MRTRERLAGLKKWIEKELCEGREMKAPAPDMNITEIKRQKPSCYLGWAPSRTDETGHITEVPYSTTPGILVMLNPAYAKYVEEKRFDRYNDVHRSPKMGQHMAVSILFSVYEPGVRMPGFVASAHETGEGMDMSLLMEGTEQGLFTLYDWLDDCKEKLLRDKSIPETDLYVEEETITYSPYTDQSYIVDKRPIYYGFVNVSFQCYADEGNNGKVKGLLL